MRMFRGNYVVITRAAPPEHHHGWWTEHHTYDEARTCAMSVTGSLWAVNEDGMSITKCEDKDLP
jgi:hypothetical protein